MFLSESDFSELIKNGPLVAIDLCIIRGSQILLGKRINPPAKNFFFVPGGRIFKSELIKNALLRILKSELGMNIKKNNYKYIKNLGIYEHFYDDNYLGNFNFSTHYIVIAYLIEYKNLIKNDQKILSQQHSEYIWLDINKVNNKYNIHSNTLEYLKNPLIKNLNINALN